MRIGRTARAQSITYTTLCLVFFLIRTPLEPASALPERSQSKTAGWFGYPTDMISHSQATPEQRQRRRRRRPRRQQQQTTPLSINIQRRYLHDECAERRPGSCVRRVRVIAAMRAKDWFGDCVRESAARRFLCLVVSAATYKFALSVCLCCISSSFDRLFG